MMAGAWWDPSDSYRGVRDLLGGPNRTFDFYSRSLKKRIEGQARKIARGAAISPEEAQTSLTKIMNLKESGDLIFLPHDESDERDSDEKYPFYLNAYNLHSLTDGSGANQPWLQENLAIHTNGNWSSWAEINPHTAEELGIGDGDWIWLESPRGKIKVQAKLYVGAMPEVVNVPLGQGHTAYGRWAEGRGSNANQILTDDLDSLTGLPLANQTRINIRKA